MERYAMNGYFCVLTTIDFFVLCFMCILTYLSETLSKKQKRGFFLAFVLICRRQCASVLYMFWTGKQHCGVRSGRRCVLKSDI